MGKREEIIEILKQIKPLIWDNNGPTTIFIGGEDYSKLNITDISWDKDIITVTTCIYLFKRKFRINKNEL